MQLSTDRKLILLAKTHNVLGMAIVKKPKWEPPVELPLMDTCLVESMAFLLDKTPQDIWQVGRQFWSKRGGMSAGAAGNIAKHFGYEFRSRYDLNFYDATDKKTGFSKRKQRSLGQTLKILDKQPREQMFLLHTTDHAIGVKAGKVLDTGNTHDRSIVYQIRQLMTEKEYQKAEEEFQKKLRDR